MAKFFESSEYVEELVKKQFADCGLESYGINLKIISTVKAKDVIQISKASATTEFLTKEDSIITVIVYEKAFEKLDEDGQALLVEGAISSISYDSEKDKILIDKSQSSMLHRMRHKYNNDILDVFEAADLAIKQIEDEEKEEKERLKQEKAEKRRNKQL